MNSFLHIADDNIKMCSDNFQALGNTVWQGNSGGIVHIGAYGTIPYEIKTANVQGLYVHRITQGGEQWDGRGGMIVMRAGYLCPSISGVYIQDVYLPSLGGDQQCDASGSNCKGLKGPNTIYRAFALGFEPTGGWTGSNG